MSQPIWEHMIVSFRSVLGMSVESAPPVGEKKEEKMEEEKEEKEEDTPDNNTHSLGAEGSFIPFSG